MARNGSQHEINCQQADERGEPRPFSPDDYRDRAKPPAGLYGRYIVTKADGTPTDPRAVYFVLRLDGHGDDEGHIEACRKAAYAWCDHAPEHLRQVADDLRQLLYRLDL